MSYIAFDLDGTLAQHKPGAGVDTIGDPIPRTVALAKKFLAEGHEVRIITARVSPEWGDQKEQAAMISAWCAKHIGQALTVQAHKCGRMKTLYDDRAIGVERNTGNLLHEVHRIVDTARAAERIREVFHERTGIHMDPRIASDIAEAVFATKDNV